MRVSRLPLKVFIAVDKSSIRVLSTPMGPNVSIMLGVNRNGTTAGLER